MAGKPPHTLIHTYMHIHIHIHIHIHTQVGVNGGGKTTTVGKIASKFAKEGKTVMLAAGDTFRAAADLQLEEWCERYVCMYVCMYVSVENHV